MSMRAVELIDLDDLHKRANEGFDIGKFDFVMLLASYGKITLEMLKFLMKHGASITETNHQGFTVPDNMAVYGKNIDYEILRYLIENGVSLKNNDSNDTFQGRLATYGDITHPMLELLVDEPDMDVNCQDASGRSFAMKMAVNDKITFPVLKTLVENGLSFETRDCQNATFVTIFASDNHVTMEMIEYLLEQGETLQTKSYLGNTVYDYLDVKQAFTRKDEQDRIEFYNSKRKQL